MEDRRKNVRLGGHDYRRAGAYFVTVCSRDRADLFGKIVGGDVLIAPKVNLSSIGAVIQNTLEQIPSITKYVIMPNHIHFIVVFQGNGSMKYIDPYTGIAEPGAFFEAAGFGGLRRIGVAAQLLRTCDSE